MYKYVRACVCTCVCLRLRVFLCLSERASMRACVCESVHAFV